MRPPVRTIRNLIYAAALGASALSVATSAAAQSADPAADPTARIAAHAAADAPTGDALPLGRSSGVRGIGGGAAAGADAAGTTGGGYLLSTAGALGLVIGLVLATRWLIVKFSGRPLAAPSTAVELLSRTAVAPKSHVLLLRVGRRVLVVGDAGGALRPLGEIDDADEVADLLGAVTASRPGSVTQSFGGLLDRFNRDQDDTERRRTEGADDSEQHTGAALDALSGLKNRLNKLGGA